MSKVKAKKIKSPAETQRPTSTAKNKTAKWKRKNWMKERFKKKKPPPKEKEKEKAKTQQTVPPVDAQQFSANWKTLQEVCH